MKILDFGSLNLDSVYQVDHFVKRGETIRARRMDLFPGGKGLNQAVAASLAGGDVWMAGNIGKDGSFLLQFLHRNEVHTEFIDTLINVNTGRAIIENDLAGDNCIIYDPGANEFSHIRQVLQVLARFRPGDYLLCQNEINNVDYLIHTADKKGMRIVYNPAPMNRHVRDMDLNCLECLVVNETECLDLLQDPQASPYEMCRQYLERYPDSALLLTLGSQGAIYAGKDQAWFMPSFPVQVKDTTGAGDTFTGYFTQSISQGMDIAHALQRSAAAAALAIQKKGAATSIPTSKEVAKFLKKNTLDPMKVDLKTQK